MVELRGRYQELMRRDFYQNTTWREDYLHITLTDEEDVPDAVSRLRVIYPYLMKLDYDNTRTRAGAAVQEGGDARQRSPLELLEEFYSLQNGQPMSADQQDFARALIETIWEGEE